MNHHSQAWTHLLFSLVPHEKLESLNKLTGKIATNNESVFSVQGVNEELVCKNHLILGQHLYKNLEGRDLDLYGGAKFRSKGNKVRLHLSSC